MPILPNNYKKIIPFKSNILDKHVELLETRGIVGLPYIKDIEVIVQAILTIIKKKST